MDDPLVVSLFQNKCKLFILTLNFACYFLLQQKQFLDISANCSVHQSLLYLSVSNPLKQPVGALGTISTMLSRIELSTIRIPMDSDSNDKFSPIQDLMAKLDSDLTLMMIKVKFQLF